MDDVGQKSVTSSISSQSQPLLSSSASTRARERRARRCGWYRLRRLNSKAAVLVLLWNLLVFSYQLESLRTVMKIFSKNLHAGDSGALADPWVALVLTILFRDSLPQLLYPLAGWLADAKFGRYKVMRASMWLMWGASVVLLLVLILRYKYTYPPDSSDSDQVQGFTVPILVVVYIVNVIGIAGFHVNIIPFGLDQMEGSSAEQYSAFIHWYYWTRTLSLGVFVHSALYSTKFVCTHRDIGVGSDDFLEPEDRMDLIILVVNVGFLTLAIILNLVFSDWLVKEPQTLNPLKTIWKISCFILKHNQPIGRRSALTYSSWAPPKRSDFAKKLYGGPFESEDVEAVKTFWNVIALLFSMGGAAIVITTANDSYSLFAKHTQSTHTVTWMYCSLQSLIPLIVPPLTVGVLIVLYEFILYPLFSCIILPMLKRMGVGMLICLIGLSVLLTLTIVEHVQYYKATCMFFNVLPDWDHRHHMHLGWLIIPIVLVSFGQFILYITAFEFICAQSPYSMRGLLIGMYYFTGGVFISVTGLILLTLAKVFGHHQSIRYISCGSTYYIVVLVLGVVGMLVYIVTAMWYRKRQRGGHELVSERAILETYYENAIRSR